MKLPKQGSLTIINSGANEAQYLDLTHLGPKHKTGINLKLPEIKTNGKHSPLLFLLCFDPRAL